MNPFENLQPVNIGQAFNQAYQQGRAQRIEGETQNALTQYALNPQDEKARQAIAKWKPELAIQLQQRDQQNHRAVLEAKREDIIAGAKIFRQIGVKDEGSYQQALATARQMGLDLSDVPPNFDPQYVNGVVAIADAFGKQAQGTAMQQNYEFLSQQDPALAQSYLRNQAEGAPLIASNGDGTFTIIPRNMAQPPQPQGEVPPPPPGFVIDGGPTPPASGNFPR